MSSISNMMTNQEISRNQLALSEYSPYDLKLIEKMQCILLQTHEMKTQNILETLASGKGDPPISSPLSRSGVKFWQMFLHLAENIPKQVKLAKLLIQSTSENEQSL